MVRSILIFLIAYSTVAPVIPVILDQVFKGLPEDNQIVATFVATGAVFVAVGAAITRILLIPQVNEWLTKLGIGATSSSAPVESSEATDESEIEEEPVEDSTPVSEEIDPYAAVNAALEKK